MMTNRLACLAALLLPAASFAGGYSVLVLQSLPGSSCTVGALNNVGQAVGGCNFTDGSVPSVHAVMWDTNTGAVVDINPANGDYAFASDINDAGQVAGSVTNRSTRLAARFQDGHWAAVSRITAARLIQSIVSATWQVPPSIRAA